MNSLHFAPPLFISSIMLFGGFGVANVNSVVVVAKFSLTF